MFSTLLVTMFSSEALALMAAGLLAPFVTQFVKNMLGVESLKAYALHVLLSTVLAAGALAVNGELKWSNAAIAFPMVITIAQTVFQAVKNWYPGPENVFMPSRKE